MFITNDKELNKTTTTKGLHFWTMGLYGDIKETGFYKFQERIDLSKDEKQRP